MAWLISTLVLRRWAEEAPFQVSSATDFDQFFEKADFTENFEKSPGGGIGQRPLKYP